MLSQSALWQSGYTHATAWLWETVRYRGKLIARLTAGAELEVEPEDLWEQGWVDALATAWGE